MVARKWLTQPALSGLCPWQRCVKSEQRLKTSLAFVLSYWLHVMGEKGLKRMWQTVDLWSILVGIQNMGFPVTFLCIALVSQVQISLWPFCASHLSPRWGPLWPSGFTSALVSHGYAWIHILNPNSAIWKKTCVLCLSESGLLCVACQPPLDSFPSRWHSFIIHSSLRAHIFFTVHLWVGI